MADFVSRAVDLVASGSVGDFTVRQIALLGLLCDEAGPHRVRHLAQRLNVQKPVVSRAVTKLANDGLVQRWRDNADRRDVSIMATAAGTAVREHMREFAHGLASQGERVGGGITPSVVGAHELGEGARG